MYIKQALGAYGEDLACKYLQENNYKIVQRNFRCKQGEIDIIAKDMSKKELVFIEVKTRSSFNFGRPAQAVNSIKQKHIFNVANYYIYSHCIKDIPLRFDVIEVFVENYHFKINHIMQVF